jgi:hypothetical protein
MGLRHKGPWYTLAEGKELARRWSRIPEPGHVTCQDRETDEFLFGLPGEEKPRRFRPLVLSIDGVPTKVGPLGTLPCTQQL